VDPQQREAAEFYAVLMGGRLDEGPPDPESPLGRLLEVQAVRPITEADIEAALRASAEWLVRERGASGIGPDGLPIWDDQL
jgi:hypothetical protein